MQAKKRRFKDTYKPQKRVKSRSHLIFTVSSINIRKKSSNVKTLRYDPKSGIWTNIDSVEYHFDNSKFTASRVAFGMLYPSPY